MAFDLSGLGDILSAGGGIVDSIFGGGGADDANKISKKQLKFMMKMAQAGQTDALGNRLYYDPKTNSWTTELNPTSRATQVASDQEELNRLLFDLPRERTERASAAEGRRADSEIADTLRRRIIDRNPMTADRLEGEIYDAKSRGIRETTDKLGSQLATQGLRTGVNPGRSLDELSRTLARELGNARSDSRLEALTGADDINARRGNTAIDQYGAMESRARNVSNTPFNPASLSAGLTAIGAGKQGALGAVGGAGRTAAYTAGIPDETYGKLGTSIGSLFDVLGGLTKKGATRTTTGNTTYTG